MTIIAKEGHPLKTFTVGSYKTLKKEGVLDKMKEFFEQ